MSGDYELELPGLGVTFIADRIRRDHHELQAELTVRCTMPGARTVNGVLNTSDFNFSSLRARQDRAKLLAQRAQTDGQVDWFALLEDFCQKVFQSERTGDPAIKLRDVALPEKGDDIAFDGIYLPRRHQSILFGDGGACKSMIELYLAGQLVQRGFPVVLCDWELDASAHRERYGQIFCESMPEHLYYLRCERPLTAEADRIRRVVREHNIHYAFYDSVAFACDGPPEAAEVAARYFRACREIGIGGLHVAHVTKGENGDQKPFGSAFWSNGARSTWYVKAVEQSGDESTMQLGFWNRKTNLGPIRAPTSLIVDFSHDHITFARTDITQSPELAGKLTIRQRMTGLLRRGSRTVQEISDELEERVDSIQKTVKRNGKYFIVLEGGRIGLLA